MASTRSDNQKVRLTKSVVEKLPVPSAGQAFLRDAELKGFGLRITPGAKSFIVEKRIDGRVKRLTLGRYPELTVEQARKEAQKLLGKIATGVNPIAERRAAELERTTLAEAFEDFKRIRKALKPRTLYDYERLMRVAFEPWGERPLRGITKQMVLERHAQLGTHHGEAYANLAMRFLRALFNFAMAQYEDGFGHPLLTENPVVRLTQTRAWYRVERRQSVIRPHQLPAWFRAVQELKQGGERGHPETIADYLLLLLFTGLRRQEAARLKWADVDFAHRMLTIHDTKNREPLLLPLSDYLVELLRHRRLSAEGDYVFAGPGKAGYLIEPRKQMARVVAASAVPFTLHDLRRTFVTIAEGLDIPAYAIKRLVNHKAAGDVTAGYIVADVERLRAPMQRITDYLLRAGLPTRHASVTVLAPTQMVRPA